METTHGLTYSVARVTEVTAWQSFDAICRVVQRAEVTLTYTAMWEYTTISSATL